MRTSLLVLTLAAGPAAAFCPPAGDVPPLTEIAVTEGSGYLDGATLAAIVAQAVGQCAADVAGLSAVAERINAAYDEVGARLAFARPVELDGTRGRVELVEITYGEIIVAPTKDTDPAYVLRRAQTQAGDLADLEALQSSLAVLPETDDIRVVAELQPGAEEGTSDLILTVEEPERWQRAVTLSNSGAPDVGEWRLGLAATRSSLTGLRDPLSFGASVGEGALALDAGYSRPVGNEGARIGAALSLARNRFVNAAPPVDDLENRVATLRLDYSWPLNAGDEGNDILNAGLTLTRERSALLGVDITEQDIAEFTLGSSHVRRDPGSSITAISQRIGLSRLQDGLAADATILRWSGTALHARLLSEDWTLTGQFDWQLSNTAVAAAQVFSATGPAAVRGYPTSEGGSDAGYVVRVELGRDFGDGEGADFGGFLFADAGRGWDRVAGGGSVAKDPIYSAGIGATASIPLGGEGVRLNLRVTAAVPLANTATFRDRGEVDVLFDASLSF